MPQPLFPTRTRNIVSGINGVVSPGTAVVQMDVNKRYHRISFFTTTGAGVLTNPATVITSLQLSVNGVIIRDITPAQVIAIAKANGYTPSTGELPLFFSEEWRRFTEHESVTSWDMFNQPSFQIRFVIAGSLTTPGITGVAEFDYFRNAIPGKNGAPDSYFLSPIKQHAVTIPVPLGVYDITVIDDTYPIQRIWLSHSVASAITYVQVIADGNTVHEGDYNSMLRMLAQYGFDGTQFDYSLVFDMTNHLREALVVKNSLIVRVTSSSAGNVTAVVESRTDGYK